MTELSLAMKLVTRRAALAILAAARGTARKPDDLTQGFTQDSFEAAGIRKTYFYIGTGSPVLFLHELPGLAPEAFAFARRLNQDTGLSVYLPLFFGPPGGIGTLKTFLRTPCQGPEFHCGSDSSLGRIVDWIEGFCLKIRTRDRRSLAVIGNCLTGSMPLALMARPALKEALSCAVLSQPAVPLGLFGKPWSQSAQRALGLSESELRLAIESRIPVYAQKFIGDPYVPEVRLKDLKARFDAWPGRFPGQFVYEPVAQGCPGSMHHTGHAHAVLTEGYCPVPGSGARLAYEKVRDFVVKHQGEKS